jgi:HD-GYP domain-containing protein (c-di-GMP phosphodiesterase class II)
MEIPFAARIFPVIDVWDALISDRPYRKALPHAEVREHIKTGSGKHFDPNVVRAFLDLKDLSI